MRPPIEAAPAGGVPGLAHEAAGHLPAINENDADLIIVNTCSIRDKAEQKVYSQLGRYRDLKKENPGLLLGVCGCVAQQQGVRVVFVQREFPTAAADAVAQAIGGAVVPLDDLAEDYLTNMRASAKAVREGVGDGGS